MVLGQRNSMYYVIDCLVNGRETATGVDGHIFIFGWLNRTVWKCQIRVRGDVC